MDPAGTEATEANGGHAAALPAITRIRTHSPELAAVIREAGSRSTTFHGLQETIERSDGIVYVEPGQCGPGVRACLVTVTTTGLVRILHVKVERRQADVDLRGAIGHELQHAVEVLGNLSVRSTVAMFFFYTREGRRLSQGFETDAAVRAGDRVRREVRRPGAAAAQ